MDPVSCTNRNWSHGRNDSNLLYLSGVPHKKVVNDEIISQVVKLVEDKINEKNN